jgi:hypothetical protein
MSPPHDDERDPGPGPTPIPEEAPDGPDPDTENLPPVPLQARSNRGTITNCGTLQWAVDLPVGRDPESGKIRQHYKAIRGPKKAAEAYLDWYAGLVAGGEAPETVSQSELQDLATLERRAAEFPAKLLARVKAGERVEPGPLRLLA